MRMISGSSFYLIIDVKRVSMAKAESNLTSGRYSVRSTSENVYGIHKINFSVNNALKPKNRMPDYVCSRLEENRWKVTYTNDEQENKEIKLERNYNSAEEIASAIDQAYQSAFNQTS